MWRLGDFSARSPKKCSVDVKILLFRKRDEKCKWCKMHFFQSLFISISIMCNFISDLFLGMRRLHETFVALAGRLQSVHNQVESQKDTFLNVRRHLCNDLSNPFEKISQSTAVNVGTINSGLIYSPPKVATGPTPFNQMSFFNGNPLVQQQNQSAYSSSVTSAAPSGKL